MIHPFHILVEFFDDINFGGIYSFDAIAKFFDDINFDLTQFCKNLSDNRTDLSCYDYDSGYEIKDYDIDHNKAEAVKNSKVNFMRFWISVRFENIDDSMKFKERVRDKFLNKVIDYGNTLPRRDLEDRPYVHMWLSNKYENILMFDELFPEVKNNNMSYTIRSTDLTIPPSGDKDRSLIYTQGQLMTNKFRHNPGEHVIAEFFERRSIKSSKKTKVIVHPHNNKLILKKSLVYSSYGNYRPEFFSVSLMRVEDLPMNRSDIAIYHNEDILCIYESFMTSEQADLFMNLILEDIRKKMDDDLEPFKEEMEEALYSA